MPPRLSGFRRSCQLAAPVSPLVSQWWMQAAWWSHQAGRGRGGRSGGTARAAGAGRRTRSTIAVPSMRPRLRSLLLPLASPPQMSTGRSSHVERAAHRSSFLDSGLHPHLLELRFRLSCRRAGDDMPRLAWMGRVGPVAQCLRVEQVEAAGATLQPPASIFSLRRAKRRSLSPVGNVRFWRGWEFPPGRPVHFP